MTLYASMCECICSTMITDSAAQQLVSIRYQVHKNTNKAESPSALPHPFCPPVWSQVITRGSQAGMAQPHIAKCPLRAIKCIPFHTWAQQKHPQAFITFGKSRGGAFNLLCKWYFGMAGSPTMLSNDDNSCCQAHWAYSLGAKVGWRCLWFYPQGLSQLCF